MPPANQIAAVVCMDARLETGALLGLVEGDAHVIRNAGGLELTFDLMANGDSD